MNERVGNSSDASVVLCVFFFFFWSRLLGQTRSWPIAPGAPPAHAPPETPDEKPKPVERIQKLRVGVRAIWWSALVLTLAFAGAAIWRGFGRRDPFALFFVLLAGLCALAGYGAVAATRQR